MTEINIPVVCARDIQHRTEKFNWKYKTCIDLYTIQFALYASGD